MANAWRWIIGWLVWLSADPESITIEKPKAAAAVAVAYAALAPEPDAPPAPPKPVGPVSAPCKNGACPLPSSSIGR